MKAVANMQFSATFSLSEEEIRQLAYVTQWDAKKIANAISGIVGYEFKPEAFIETVERLAEDARACVKKFDASREAVK